MQFPKHSTKYIFSMIGLLYPTILSDSSLQICDLNSQLSLFAIEFSDITIWKKFLIESETFYTTIAISKTDLKKNLTFFQQILFF